MSRRDRLKRRHRRALGVAMALSIAAHALALGLAKWDVSVWSGPEDGSSEARATIDRYEEQRPLHVVRLRLAGEAPSEAVSGPAAAAAGEVGGLAFEPRLPARPRSLELAPVAPRPAPLPLAGTPPADARTVTGDLGDPNRGVVFVGASEAARLAERDLERAARTGRLAGASGRGRGISISIVGGGADCDTPVTGVFDTFAGSFGRPGPGRRF